MKALFKACFLVALGVLVISLSGCTMPDLGLGGGDTPYEGIMSSELTSDLTRVSDNDYTNLYLIIGNPSNLESYTQNTYHVRAKVINIGRFDSSSETQEQDADMLGVKQKTFTWKLNAAQVPAETPATVTVQLNVEKTEVFLMPPVLFATKEFAVANEVRGSPLQGGPKILSFSDNFINVIVDLNQQPPVIAESCLDGSVGANVKFTPINGLGTINVDSIDVDDGSCDESIDNLANTAQCSFNCDTPDATEKHFKFTVTYTYRLNQDYTFTIYPSYTQGSGSSGTRPSSGTGTAPSGGGSTAGPTPSSGARLTVSGCGASCGASCSFAQRNGVQYTGCSDSNLRALLVNSGCTITLSDGSACS